MGQPQGTHRTMLRPGGGSPSPASTERQHSMHTPLGKNTRSARSTKSRSWMRRETPVGFEWCFLSAAAWVAVDFVLSGALD